MKKITLALAFLLAVMYGHAQTSWELTLNSPDTEDKSKLGTENEFGINFYTGARKKMTLDIAGKLKIDSLSASGRHFLQVDDDGVLFRNNKFGTSETGNVMFVTQDVKFGIGTTTPGAALDVNGDLGVSNQIRIANDFYIAFTPANSNRPRTGWFGIRDYNPLYPPPPPPVMFDETPMPCNAFHVGMVDGVREGNTFSNAFTFADLVQVFNQSTGVVMSLGINNGNGIIAVENNNAVLRLNPGCNNDVFICEGGGFTKIFNSAGVLGDLTVSKTVKIGSAAFSNIAAIEVNFDVSAPFSDAMHISNNSVLSSNKRIFDIGSIGETYIGTDLQHNSGMLTVGQASKTDPALCLTDNTSTTNKDFFTVYGNGYTELNVYSPYGMPSGRVLAIKDMANAKDLFVVKASGKVYAREVEISLVQYFPDYVFAKDYKLRSITEVSEYIAHNKHLPGFEKAEYYEKNGINVNDMFIKQQEKIEELTLYIIDLEKRLQAVEKNK